MNVVTTRPSQGHDDASDPRMAEVLDVIERGRRFLITGHMNPDGDVLGFVDGDELGVVVG